MNHDEAHGLQIQLSAALKERDDALAREARLAAANKTLAGDVTRCAGIESERDALRAALTTATDGLFAARNMLQAINEGDPTPDRKRAADRAWDAEKKARAALASGGDRG